MINTLGQEDENSLDSNTYHILEEKRTKERNAIWE